MSVVVDASAIVALLLPDESQGAIRLRLERWLESGESLHAPAVLPFEVSNVLARLVFDGDLDEADVADIWNDLADLGMALHPFDLKHDGHGVAAITTQLRRRHATDSTYICLAHRLATTMWTLDGSLARNAADVGLPVRLIT